MTMTDDELAWMKAIAKRVKIARVQHDLSQADLAERALGWLSAGGFLPSRWKAATSCNASCSELL